MLALGLTLTLLATPEALPSARLLTEEPLLTPADVMALERELRILDGNIQQLRPNMPKGYVVGMALGFSFAVLLLPGIPLLIAGATSTGFAVSALLAFGGVLTGLGGVSLLAALICAVLGNTAETEMAEERARMVERRDALQRRLAPYRPTAPTPGWAPVPSAYPPGVQLDLPTPRLVTLARF